EDKVKEIIRHLTNDLPYLTHEVSTLTYNDYNYSEIYEMKLSKLFEAVDKVTLESENLNLDLSSIKGKSKQPKHLNVDYSQLITMCDLYSDSKDEYHDPNGTVFYIQQNEAQYVIRKEENHLEFYSFKQQFDEAFKASDRLPFFVIEFKAKNEMSQK